MPTKGRVQLAKRAVESALEKATGEVEVILGVDESEVDKYQHLGVRMVALPDGHGGSWKVNRLAPYATGEAMMCGHDDLIWRTQGWDERLLALLAEDPLQVLYCRDSQKAHNGLCEPIVSRQWYELGGFYPPHFHHFLGDVWVTGIAKNLGKLRFVEDVVIEHCHFKTGSGAYDATYRARHADTHQPWKETAQERQQITERIRKAIAG